MVATVLRLRATLTRRVLARETWRAVLLGLGLLWALLMVPSLLGGMLWLSGQTPDVAHDVVVVAGTVLVLGWTVVPVLLPALDDSLDVRRFAPFAVPARRLAPALLASSVLGVPTAFTGLVCLAPALAWWGIGGAGAGVVAVLAAPLALATCVLASRLSTGVATRVLASRRSREAGAVVGLVVAGLAVPAVLAAGARGLEGTLEGVPRAAAVLGWTPFGLAFAAPAAAAAGRPGEAVARLALAAAWVGLGVAAWTVLVRLALVRPPARGGQVRRRRDGVLPGPGREPGPGRGAAWAVARRGLRSWATDPRYTSAALGAVVAPVVIVLLVAPLVDAPVGVALAVGPVMAASLGWGRHNDVALDGSAFWLHVTARVPGWADRLGRSVATLVWALPVVVVAAVVGALVAGRPDLAPATAGAAVGVLSAGLAVSAVFSAVRPYPVPEAGGNPFAAPVGAVGASLVAQVVTSAATTVLAAPVLVVLVVAASGAGDGGTLGAAALALGVLGGAGTLAAGVVVGGRVYDARQTAVLARLT